MGKKKINTTVWMTMMKRYTIIGGIGLCVFTVSLWRIYTLAGHVKPMWLSMVAGTGALMLASGMFGLAVSCFFHLWFKPSVQDSGTVLSESNRNA